MYDLTSLESKEVWKYALFQHLYGNISNPKGVESKKVQTAVNNVTASICLMC